MARLRERVDLESPLPVDEVERRLAAATAAWAGEPFGRALPAPPWPAGRFAACEPAGGRWLALPVVVSGEVVPLASGSRLTAAVRPHGWAALPYALAAAVLAGSALAGGAPVFAALWLVLVGAVGFHNLSAHVSGRAAELRGVLAGACGVPRAAARGA